MTAYEIICQRGSVGVQIKGGSYKVCAANEPRFSDKGLLIESVKTNKCPYSNKIVVEGAAGTVQETVLRGFPLWTCARTATAGGDFRNSFSYDAQRLQHVFSFITTTNNPSFTIHFTKEGQTTKTLDRGPVTSIGHGLYRCTTVIPANFLDTETGWSLNALFDTARGTNLVVGCLQLERGPLVTSPIPTNGSPVTRDRDYFQIKNLPTTGRSVYHFHWSGENTTYGRFEIMAYENPTRRDKYRLIRLWQTTEGSVRNKHMVAWNTAQSGYSTGSSATTGEPFKVDVLGHNGTSYTMFINSTKFSDLIIPQDYTHGQIAIRGTIDISGDDPEREAYAYHISDLQIYDRTLTEAEMDQLDTASPPGNRLFVAPLTEDLSATRSGYAWVPDFKGTGYMTVSGWTPVGGDATFGDCEVDIVFKMNSLTKNQYLFDSRTEDTYYCYYDAASKKLRHTLDGICTVNGITSSEFIFENAGDTYHVIFSNVRLSGMLLDKIGARYDNMENLDGELLSVRLRDMQYDVEDVSGAQNRSRYYDFVQWTNTTTAPINDSIPDTWNTGKNDGTLTNCTWVRL